jgi:hypothetical protein
MNRTLPAGSSNYRIIENSPENGDIFKNALSKKGLE